MRLRTEFVWSVGIPVAFNLLLAFGAIGLFARMGPAIERILTENVYSNEAAERMLVILLEPPGDVDPDERRRGFDDALRRATINVTEPEEIPVLEDIAERSALALVGDPTAVRDVVRAVERLVSINRRTMNEADRQAQRLGTAGAWSAVIIALTTFGISAVVAYRLQRRVLDPLLHLHDVLTAVREGDRYRRCRSFAASADVRRVLESLNVVLDRQIRNESRPSEVAVPSREHAHRAALLELLDERPEPTVVVDPRGEIVAANRRGLAILADEGGQAYRDRLRDPEDETLRDGLTRRALRDEAGWLCVLEQQD